MKQLTVLMVVLTITGLASLGALGILAYQMQNGIPGSASWNAQSRDVNPDLESRIDALSTKLDRITQHKCQAKFVTPVKFQAKRGTCWDFTTLAILEQTYRRQGIEHGWLDEMQYVVFSEHAYGVAVIEYCRNNEAHCPHARITSNSTDGGFISWLYYFKSLHDKVVPNSVCPYVEDPTSDHKCEEYHTYLKVNPLDFNVTDMRTMYDLELIKEHLRIHKNTMAWISILGTVTYYVPCIGSFANTTACNESKCTHCPLDLKYPTQCCVKESRAGWNLDGEFYMHREMEEVGAHAMTLVGYNDNFVSQEGHRGGFIVKNSWGAWHSHTLQYFMNEMSAVNEGEVCPNSRNPRKWTPGQTILVCTDTHYCDEGVRYEVTSITDGPDETVVMCFNKRNVSDEAAQFDFFGFGGVGKNSECSPPMPLDLYADFFEPISEQIEPNDEDSCGFFFFPYVVAEEINKRFGFFWVTDFDIRWSPQSYAANAAKYPKYDYHEVMASTTKAFIPSYPDALPFFPPEDGDTTSRTRIYAMDHSPLKGQRNSKFLKLRG